MMMMVMMITQQYHHHQHHHPIRPDAKAYFLSSGMDPTRSDPMSEIVHPLPEWTRPYPTRYRTLCILHQDESDILRSVIEAWARVENFLFCGEKACVGFVSKPCSAFFGCP
jgi:hypothetical protein